jgi:hypothetical protein
MGGYHYLWLTEAPLPELTDFAGYYATWEIVVNRLESKCTQIAVSAARQHTGDVPFKERLVLLRIVRNVVLPN